MKKKKKLITSFFVLSSLLVGMGLAQNKSEAAEFNSPFNQAGPLNLPTLGKATPQPVALSVPDAPTTQEDGKTVLQVETKVTDDSVSALKKKTYDPKDSLIKPVIASSTITQSPTPSSSSSSSSSLSMGLGFEWLGTPVHAATIQEASSNPSSDITIPSVSLSAQDGTASFDNDNNPGHDASPTNGIVRSWDTVTYLVSFAIQNTSLSTDYTNIRYRITSDLSNAITMNGTVPQVNASIINGTTYNPDGSAYTGGAGYSEGIMESMISDTGQVFVPVSVSVQGAPNGLTLQPTFKLQIVDAVDKATGKTVTFNNSYDTTDYPALTPSVETVSAAPAVTVKLIQGQTAHGVGASTVLNNSQPTNTSLYAWDVGAVESLTPLAGRSTGDFRGSTFPTGPVTYTLKLGGTYKNVAGTVVTMPNDQTNTYEMTVQGISPATYGRPGPWTPTTGGYNPGVSASGISTNFNNPLGVPNANTGQIYANMPTSNQAQIGVYSSGTFSGVNNGAAGLAQISTITNTGYTPVFNPYTYAMTGSIWDMSNSKPFSSAELIMRWDGALTASQAAANGWTRSDMSLSVNSISYNGQTVNNPNGSSNELTYTQLYTPPGGYSGSVTIWSTSGSNPNPNPSVPQPWGDESVQDLWGNGSPQSYNLATNDLNWSNNTGNAQISTGQRLNLVNQSMTQNNNVWGTDYITMWDPSAFAFDPSYPMTASWAGAGVTRFTKISYLYGVAKNLSTTPPYTLKANSYVTDYALYNWYSRTDINNKVVDPSQISAVSSHREYPLSMVGMAINYGIGDPAGTGMDFTGVPVIVKQTASGSVTPSGHRTVVMGNQRFLDASGNQMYDPIVNSPGDPRVNGGTYLPSQPSTYVTKPTSTPMTYWDWIGETAYVKPFAVTTRTSVDQKVHQTTDPINMTLAAITSGSTTDNYNGTLKSTLPAGIVYTPGSAKDAQGNPLPEPTITTTGSGKTLQQILTWTWGTASTGQQINNINVNNGLEIHIGTTSNVGNLTFNSQGLTNNLTVNTIATMTNGTADPSSDAVRSSSYYFQEQLVQQLILSKTADKPAIDVGNVDPANPNAKTSNDVTYTVTSINNSAQAVNSLNLLDVLPYTGDSRGSKFHGGYTVVSAKASLTNADGSAGTAPTLSYSTTAPSSSGINEKTDANTSINGTPVSASTDISKATMFQVTNPTPVAVGATVTLTVTLRPDNKQQAADLYVNTAGMDSSIVQPVFSQPVKTTVYGRDLSGLAWLDKNKDGLLNNGEAPVANVPVKLYRTSTVDGSFKNQLVTTDMKGNAFLDASGNSTVKTDSSGNYSFSNLPEGSYVAEFQIAGLVQKQYYLVTALDVGSDPSINSKADQTSFRTDSYLASAPAISSLPSVVGGDDLVHLKYLNLGVIQPPDTILPYTGANRMMQIGLIVASSIALSGLLAFGGRYQWLEMKKRRNKE
jgi:hypothetical protein